MTPAMRRLLLGALVLAGCNTGLDEARAERRTLEMTLIEKTEIAQNRAQHEEELKMLEGHLARLGPVTIEQVQAAAGPTRRVRFSNQNFYGDFTIEGSGGKAGVHEALQGLARLGEHLSVRLLAWSPDAWKIVASNPQVPRPSPASPVTHASKPARPANYDGDEDCRGQCVAMKRGNLELRAQLEALEAQLGPLNQVSQRKREVEQMLKVQERFAHTALADGVALMDASDLPSGQVGFDRTGAEVLPPSKTWPAP
jgi:hypothetical protein